MMERDDDRTPDQMKTHDWLVVGTDSFLSGWGRASGGASYAAWACRYDDLKTVEDWVESRGDMKRVRVVKADDYRPRGTGHLHIYVVEPGHPALGGAR